ncbi:helix-turn-helix domain-containing protein [Microlunatus elymi]|uniref:Helix-turn-helix domain-containing protein n=1 Tax=Microlunatus elymi TaxID=2596828 RepID=A0A516PUV7_9ACTN|nr:AraC family transcriptional regulator [Microlunatus elymi]QDP94933.1 helix-turn-helix domain-containing protein [Microlunatus elymi]
MAITRMRRAEVFGDDAYPLYSDRRLLEAPVAAHAHDFCEIALIVSGRAVYRTRHGSREVAVGDVVAVRSGSWHEYRSVVDFDVLNIYLGQELFAADLAWVLDYPPLTNLIFGSGDLRLRLTSAAIDRAGGWLEQLSACNEHPETVQSLQQRSLLGCVFAEFAGGATELLHPGGPTAPMSSATRAALLAMANDPARSWTAADLAAIAGVSPSHLQHQFTDRLGVSLLGWLNHYRAEQMAVRLAATGQSVARIGSEVGWTDPNYAARRFRSTYGMSPSEYRQRFAFTADP